MVLIGVRRVRRSKHEGYGVESGFDGGDRVHVPSFSRPGDHGGSCGGFATGNAGVDCTLSAGNREERESDLRFVRKLLPAACERSSLRDVLLGTPGFSE